MDNTELTTRLHDLQRSLEDGDDLARAIALIGDALERRMARIRQRLEELEADGTVRDSERLRGVVDRVASTLDTYEHDIEQRRRRMEELAEEFQRSLGHELAALRDLEDDLEADSDDA